MEYLELSAVVRTEKGNGPARRLRAAGQCPAVLYGAKTEPVMLAVQSHDMEMSLKRGGNMAFFNLTIEGADGGNQLAMVKEIQRNPVNGELLHIDFFEVDMKRKLTVKVPVHPVGKSAGVELGGMLQVIRRELEVNCLPSNIPAFIEVDISELEIGEAIHVEDIPLPDGVEIPHDVDFTVITVLSPKKDTADEEDEEGIEGEAEDEAEAPAVEE